MTIENAVNTQDTETPALDNDAKKHALIAYCLMPLGFFVVLTFFAGAIWAMLKKGNAVGSTFDSHYSNIIFTFWVSLFLGVIGVLTISFTVGYFILAGTVIWTQYRLAAGLVLITFDEPYK
jgi:uncharacterized membrane protein